MTGAEDNERPNYAHSDAGARGRYADQRCRIAPPIRDVLTAAGLQPVFEVRETPDEILLSFLDLGKASLAHIRETVGLPSCDGVRPLGNKLT
jgi:hypothetical protein